MQTADSFISDLQQQVQALLSVLEIELLPCPAVVLNRQPAPGRWSALECLEHLNRYGRHYLPALAAAVRHPAPAAPAPMRFSWLGRKSYELVRPENQAAHTTLARMNPSQSQLHAPTVLAEFREQLAQLLRLLVAAQATDLNRKAVPVEFFRLLKLRTGEALLFVVAHARRHVAQAQRALAAPVAAAAAAR